MSQYNEPAEDLEEEAKNHIRTLMSLKEEVEAVSWYHQRVAASEDESELSVLAHNRDEEIEHAAMALEWLRRNMDGWDEELRTYLFSDEPITEIEEEGEGEAEEEESDGQGPADLGLGSVE
jgi:ferritin-like protein